MREWAPPETEEDQLAWLRLFRSENVGPATFAALRTRFASPAAALAALPDLARRGGMKRQIKLAPEADTAREMAAVRKAGARFVFQGEAAYPPLLAAIDHAPPLLTVRGETEVLTRPVIAMVGARNASAAGRKIARDLAHELGARGHVIASGLARGLDTAAHEGALDSGTIAVMAGGADHVYPPQNEELYARICATGCVISEMPWGLSPQARHFPRRNRIVSGLAAGVVVVEAAARSGSLITARYAAEQNRDVFAVPGSPLDPRCEGSNRLIQDGAKLIMSADDVTDHLTQFPLRAVPRMENQPPLAFEEPDEIPDDLRSTVVGLLGGAPIGIDDLVRETGEPAGVIAGILLEMELAGAVSRETGAIYRRVT
jgi:DNA processing protein